VQSFYQTREEKEEAHISNRDLELCDSSEEGKSFEREDVE